MNILIGIAYETTSLFFENGSTYYEHLAFINAVKNKLNPDVSLKDGLIAVAVGEAAEISIKLGRVVKLNEIII